MNVHRYILPLALIALFAPIFASAQTQVRATTTCAAQHGTSTYKYYECFGDIRIPQLFDILDTYTSKLQRASTTPARANLLQEIVEKKDGLAELKTKIDQDAASAGEARDKFLLLRDDARKIGRNFRVHLTAVRAVMLLTRDDIERVAARYARPLSVLDTGFRALASNGTPIGDALTRVAADRAALTEARALSTQAFSLVRSLRPDEGNTTLYEENEAVIEEARSMRLDALAMLKDARTDIGQLLTFYRSLSGVNVTLRAPARVKGTVKIGATATSTGSSISSVSFQANGRLITTDTNAPYAAEWNSREVQNGSHTLTAVAKNADGGAATTSVTVTVDNKPYTGRYKILWAFNAGIEQTADPTPEIRTQIAQLKEMVDGYTFNVLAGGINSYWPDRPLYCGLNKKVDPDNPADDLVSIQIGGVIYDDLGALDDECDALYEAYRQTLPKAAVLVHHDAFQRIFANIDLAGEKAKGKIINAQTIVAATLFDYVPATDRVTVVALPQSIRALNNANVRPNSLYIYQEVSSGDKMLQVPTTPGSSKIGYLPNNVRVLGMIDRAFKVYGNPIPVFLLNLRAQTPGLTEAILSIKDDANFGGITFEGGTALLDPTRPSGVKFDARADQIIWAMQNTSKPVYLLMPADLHCPNGVCTETNSLESRSVDAERMQTFIRKLDAKMRDSGIVSGVCTDRLILMPGGYGYPMHPKTFPIKTPSGKFAGTIGGNIAALDELRTSLCGEASEGVAAEQSLFSQLASAAVAIGRFFEAVGALIRGQ